jgi:hypothetical protein
MANRRLTNERTGPRTVAKATLQRIFDQTNECILHIIIVMTITFTHFNEQKTGN